MANEKQLAILKQGVEIWNKWRAKNHRTRVDLRGADLRERDLFRANLDSADLRGGQLDEASLLQASLKGADLRGAQLYQADFTGADLRKADLSEALLFRTLLTDADLEKTKFVGSVFQDTILGSNDLSETDLEYVRQRGPSILGVHTIHLSRGKISKAFLRGCGFSDADMEYTKLSDPDLSNDEINNILYKVYELRANQALQFSPLFISYSHVDGTFVDKLEDYLNSKGIRFWRDVHDTTSGRLKKQIDRAIRQNPTVLLILSSHSLSSDWVEHEVRTARDLEKETGRDVLCPIALDGSWKSSPWPKRIMEQIMEYNILDFSAWQDDSKFDYMFRRLIDGLELFYKR